MESIGPTVLEEFAGPGGGTRGILDRGVPPKNEKNTLLYGKDIDKKYTLIYGNIRKSDPCLRIYIKPTLVYGSC